MSIETASLELFCQQLARHMQLDRGFSICLVSDRRMRELNRRYAGKDRTTDVLSFPDEREDWEVDEGYAGDIVISVEKADRQKKSTLENELMVLTLHGVLHLWGYDHEVDEGEMMQLESTLKREFQLQ